MAFISMHLLDTTFHFRFGRNEENHYVLKLDPVSAQIGSHNVLVVAKGGVLLEVSDRAEETFPMFIGNIEKPMGDTASLEELMDFFNEIVTGTKSDQFPNIVMTLPGLKAGVSGEEAKKGVLLVENANGFGIIVTVDDRIELNNRLSCSKHLMMHGLDPMISSLVDHRFFGNQVITAMMELSKDHPDAMEASAQKFMEELDGGDLS